VEFGPALAGAVCTRMFAELGAVVLRIDPPGGSADDIVWQVQHLMKSREHLDIFGPRGRARLKSLINKADLVVSTLHPLVMDQTGLDVAWLPGAAPAAVVVCITPFGLTGPRSRLKGGDLVAFHSSGIARLLAGQVEDPQSSPPVRAFGEQSEFVAGATAACAAMHALYGAGHQSRGALIDVSVQEAMACMAVQELALPAFGKPDAPRRRVLDGGGATVCILPTSDGYVAISPREEHQWQSWLDVMGKPEWGKESRFATKPDRINNWDALHELMSQWSRKRKKVELSEAAQSAHVPSFPLSSPADLLASPQLRHREFFKELTIGSKRIMVPTAPYQFHHQSSDSPPPITKDLPGQHAVSAAPDRLPLAGVRVLDFSWVIAGPTCTRYLAAMGAEVIKVETSSRPDPGRASELHSVLGQSKLGITLDLKQPVALELVKRLIAKSDVVVENFATGVMERLGLGRDVLHKLRPDLVMLSASGMGRTGPDASKVAYGTLIQSYTGFAALNGFPDRPPAVGMAWADPVCGLMMAFAVVATLRSRSQTGRGAYIDFSMVEALLSTMPGPLVEYQLIGRKPAPQGNDDLRWYPHDVYRCKGDDSWLAVAVTSDAEWSALCEAIGASASIRKLGLTTRRERRVEVDPSIARWARLQEPGQAAAALQSAGVPAASSAASSDLFADRHLEERGFYTRVAAKGGARRLPGLPWKIANGTHPRHAPAPQIGEHTDVVLRSVLGMTEPGLVRLRESSALT